MRAALFLICLICTQLATAADPVPGDAAPALLGRDQHGESFDLAQWHGTVVVVTFWASWCPPCLKELPVLEALQKQVPQAELRVVGVNIEDASDYRRILKHLGQSELTFTNDRRGRIRDRYGVGPIPHLYLIDHEGKVAFEHVGYTPDQLDGFVEEINELLRRRHEALNAPGAG
jgi:thiol-disulfide isomerase/thioredoxin